MDDLLLLYSRALDLLSRSSVYLPRDLKNEIVKLARDGGRAGIRVRVELAGGMVIIDPWKALGCRNDTPPSLPDPGVTGS